MPRREARINEDDYDEEEANNDGGDLDEDEYSQETSKPSRQSSSKGPGAGKNASKKPKRKGLKNGHTESEKDEPTPFYLNGHYYFIGFLFFGGAGSIVGQLYAEKDIQPIFAGITGLIILVGVLYACFMRCCTKSPIIHHHEYHHPGQVFDDEE